MRVGDGPAKDTSPLNSSLVKYQEREESTSTECSLKMANAAIRVLGACAAGIHGCESASARPFLLSISSNVALDTFLNRPSKGTAASNSGFREFLRRRLLGVFGLSHSFSTVKPMVLMSFSSHPPIYISPEFSNIS